jgi:hypothetical protein
VVVDADQARAVGHGSPLPGDLGATGATGPVAVLGPDGSLLAVCERQGALLRPVVVVAEPG